MRITLQFLLFKLSDCKISVLILLLIIFSTCIVRGQVGTPGYNVSAVSPENINVKSPASNISIFEDWDLQFVVPPGWKPISSDSGYYFEKSKNKLSFINKKGAQVWIWRQSYKSNSVMWETQKMIEDDITRFAPIHEQLKTYKIKSLKGGPVYLIVGLQLIRNCRRNLSRGRFLLC